MMGYLKGQVFSLVSTYLKLWMWFCQHVFGTQIPQPPEKLLNWLFNHNRLHILEFLADVYFPYGIFRFQKRLYLLDPKLSLKAGHKLGKGASDYLFNSPLKSSILNVSGKAHQFRQATAASFRKSRMEMKSGVMQGVIEKAVSKLAEMDVVDMSNFTLKVSLDVIGRVLFEIDLEALDGKQEPLQRAMDTVFYRCCALGQVSFDSQEFVESGKTIQSVADSILKDSLDQSEDEQSFIHLVNNSGSIEVARSTLGTFLIVGSETTSTIMSLMLHVLAQRPQLQKELQQEADEWIDRLRTDVSSVPPKLESAIKELLRMYSIGPYITRRVDTDIDLGRFTIPAKSDLRIFLWGIQKSQHLWHDSKSYCAGRFTKSSPTNQSRSWFPFGAGPRMCPGQHLAWVELSLMMTYFMHNFNFRRVSQTRDLEVCVDWEHTVLYPNCHVILGVQKRSH